MINARRLHLSAGRRVSSKLLNRHFDWVLGDLLSLDQQITGMVAYYERAVRALEIEQALLAGRSSGAPSDLIGVDAMSEPTDQIPAVIDRRLGVVHLPWQAPPRSALTFLDAEQKPRVLPGYRVEISSSVASAIDHGDPTCPLVESGPDLFWREFIQSLDDREVPELVLRFPIPSELAATTASNFLVLDPFPSGSVDVAEVAFEQAGQDRVLTDLVRLDAGPLVYSAYIPSAAALRVRLRAGRTLMASGQAHSHLGLRRLSLLFGLFETRAWVDVNVALPPGAKRIEDVEVVLANPAVTTQADPDFPWVSLHLTSFIEDSVELRFDQLPADILGDRLVVRLGLRCPQVLGPSPLVRGVRVKWTSLSS